MIWIASGIEIHHVPHNLAEDSSFAFHLDCRLNAPRRTMNESLAPFHVENIKSMRAQKVISHNKNDWKNLKDFHVGRREGMIKGPRLRYSEGCFLSVYCSINPIHKFNVFIYCAQFIKKSTQISSSHFLWIMALTTLGNIIEIWCCLMMNADVHVYGAGLKIRMRFAGTVNWVVFDRSIYYQTRRIILLIINSNFQFSIEHKSF